jgi:hypothetical protein
MKTRQWRMLFALFITLFHTSGFAQDNASCSSIVLDAMDAVASLCGDIGRNQACYGNIMLEVEAQAGVEDLVFDAPGDIANVADIHTLRLTGMDETTQQWGMALMKLQANLPSTLPGQNVVLLLVGDANLRNASPATREGYAPMQAFYFRSGVGDSACSEAPESGILIQTPERLGQIALRINNVDIVLGSTVFLQAVAGDALYVHVLEGQALVTAFDTTQMVSVGMMVAVPIDEHLVASGTPSSPRDDTDDGVWWSMGDGNVSLNSLVEMISVIANTEYTPPSESGIVYQETFETAPVAVPDTIDSGSDGEVLAFDASACPYERGTVYELEANRAYTIRTWPGCWLTTSDAQASKAEVNISVTINGVPSGVFAGFGPIGACAPSDGGYNFLANYQIEPLSPGRYIIQVVHDHPGGRMYSPNENSEAWTWTETCTVQVGKSAQVAPAQMGMTLLATVTLSLPAPSTSPSSACAIAVSSMVSHLGNGLPLD